VPSANYVGADSFTVTVSDGQGGSAEQVVNVTVTAVNDAPVVAVAIADQSSAEDTAWSYQVPAGTFSDVDGDTLTYSASLGDGSALPGWLTFTAATQTFSGTPPLNVAGDISLTVTASDGSLSASYTFVLTVTANNTAPNDAPVVDFPLSTQTTDEDTAWSFAIEPATFSDPNGDPLTYSATLGNGSALPTWLTFTADTQTFSGTPPADFTGSLSLKVTATDGNLAVSSMFDLIVTPVNDAPAVAVAIADQSSAEDTAWSYQVAASAFSDAESDALTYSATLGDGSVLPDWLRFDAVTRTFSGTPPLNFAGSLSLTVTASDGVLSGSDTFVLTVTPVNDAPVVASIIADQSSARGAVWSYQVPAGTFSDVDGNALTYSAALGDGSALPAWLTFTAATRTFSGTPPADFPGSLSLKVTASDGAFSVSDTFVLIVEAAPPIIVANGQTYVATAGVDIFVIDSSQNISATIVGFDFGDVLRYVSNSTPPVFDFPYVAFDDGTADITTATSRITLTNLVDDFFATVEDFQSVFGPNAITVL